MPLIARQHLLGKDPYTPSEEWPEHVGVQWGGGGLVIRKDGSSYGTAFFEVFPHDNAGGFIRGEGETIAQAETVALAKYQRQFACQHIWGRRGYSNGGGRCVKCKAFQGNVFKPIVTLGAWRKPLTPIEDWLVTDSDPPESTAYRHKLGLRKKLYGVGPRGLETGMGALIERLTPIAKD